MKAKALKSLPPQSEKSIQKQCLDWLTLKGIFHYRNNTGAVAAQYKGKQRFIRFGHPGISDIIGIAPDGRFLAIEVKRADGKLTEAQEVFLEQVEKSGGIALVVRSLEDLIKAFKAHFGE